MLEPSAVKRLEHQDRQIEPARTGDELLGPFALLPGVWANEPELPGRGWNMIALPFAHRDKQPPRPFRLLLNQYNEQLTFSLVDKAVPNRGIGPGRRTTSRPVNRDQFAVALDYEQGTRQIAAADFPDSGLAGGADLAIHHEPGLFLNFTDPMNEDQVDIARLATVPHGDSVLALGKAQAHDGPPDIPALNALPLGVSQDLATNPNLAPYKHFHENLFEGLFDPTDPTALLRAANDSVDIVRTTRLEFDSTVATGGISNIPFVVRQANASEMKSTFWIQELAETNPDGTPRLRLQYLQIVQLDFFARGDGGPGLVKWPHVSINTMVKVQDQPGQEACDRVAAVMPDVLRR